MAVGRPVYTFDTTVFDATLARIKWLMEEFDGNVCVASSGGKDSTIVVEMALRAARETGRLPLKVYWLDQECEFAATVAYQRYLADNPEIDFRWYQIPFRLFNAANHDDAWLNVWGEGEQWARSKESDSIHANQFGVDRFKDVLRAIDEENGGAVLTGMRMEESPARRLTLMTNPRYKWVTWSGGKTGGKTIRFHPIYDWTYQDVWHAIETEGWRYNTHYDQQFRYGLPVHLMRVSNYHHETALEALFLLQECEPETWEAATHRLTGLNHYSQQTRADIVPTKLPIMFASWEEYMHHLIDNITTKVEWQEYFRHRFAKTVAMLPYVPSERIARMMVAAVIKNDFWGTTIDMFIVAKRDQSWHKANPKRPVLEAS